MKKFNLLLVVLFIHTGLLAQITGRVTGKVADSLTGKPVAFATITIFTVQQQPLKNGIADSLGNFSVTGIEPGNYYLVISATGYETVASAGWTISGTTPINLSLFLLPPSTGMLTEVTITRPLLSTSTDGFTYNAANDIIQAGSDASDLLRKIPMLTVNQTGSPMLRGSSNIRVFIDDKPSDIYAPSVADALKQIPAEDIERVAIILYPSAKYDAEGTDGVINIITRKNRFNAINATLRGLIGNISRNFTPALNIRQGNWIITSNTGWHGYTNKNSAVFFREDFTGGIKNRLLQNSKWNNNGRVFYSGANVMYVFNELQSASAGYRYRMTRNYTERSTVNNFFQQDSLSTAFTRNTNSGSGNNMHTFNVGYNGKSVNRKKHYSLLAMYFTHKGFDYYGLDQQRQQVVDYREQFQNTMSNSEFIVQADYTQTINDKFNWDAGAKTQARNFGSHMQYTIYDFTTSRYLNDDDRSNRFSYRRHIHALYGNATLQLKSWQLRTGIRYEQTLLKTVFKNDVLSIPGFNNLIPSVILSKKLNNKEVLKWSYGKRILRPYMGHINPGINYIDSFTISSGNPNLQPEVTHRYEMGYTYTSGPLFMMASLFYNNMRNGIEQVRVPEGNGIFRNTYSNVGKINVWGLSFSVTRKWMQQLTLTATLNLRYSNLESVALQQKINGFRGDGTINISYTPGKGYSLEALGYTSTNILTIQGFNEVWKYYAFVFTKKFMGDKLALSLRLENLLSPAHQRLTQTWTSSLFQQQQTTRYQNHYYWLSFSWKLGKKEVKVPAVRQEAGSDN